MARYRRYRRKGGKFWRRFWKKNWKYLPVFRSDTFRRRARWFLPPKYWLPVPKRRG